MIDVSIHSNHQWPSGLGHQFRQVKILVVGDVMLDVYRIADVSRICPEAPVPILLNPITENRLGGAGAVAAMCAALGASVSLCGLVGDDLNGWTVQQLLKQSNVQPHLQVTPQRPTTTKERLCGIASGRHRQLLIRTDIEDARPLCFKLESALARNIGEVLENDDPDIVLISDYAKGVCCQGIRDVLRDVRDRTIVDPPKSFAGFATKYYSGVSCLVPNRLEAGLSTAAELTTKFQTAAAIIKLDEEGCEVAECDHDSQEIQQRRCRSQARAVHDVTGAGDQFLAVLGCCRAAGLNWFTAAELANVAAGLQVERHGCVPVTLQELTDSIQRLMSYEVPCLRE